MRKRILGKDKRWHIFHKRAGMWMHPDSRKSICGRTTSDQNSEIRGLGSSVQPKCPVCEHEHKPTEENRLAREAFERDNK